MKLKLNELKILEKSNEYQLMDLWNQLLLETYVIIAENIDLSHVYEYNLKTKNWWEFKDIKGIEHEIRLNFNAGVDNKELTVKFYWVKDNKPSYTKPPYTDERVFNTHMKVFIEEILPKLPELLNHFKLDKLTLDPLDSSRYRLYRIALNQVLDKSKYELIEDEKNQLLYIKLK